MTAKFAILIFLIIAGGIFTSIATFNFTVDPMCYYRCSKIDVHKKNVNTYYHVGQIILAHPEAEAVMIGSSRGETTSPVWLEKITGLKTLNLSVGGTELQAKLAFLNIALQNNHIRRVIWQADLFELIPEIIDMKMKNTEALRSYLVTEFPGTQKISLVSQLTSLFDHATFEAALGSFKKKNQKALDLGSGFDINYADCESLEFKSEKTEDELRKDIVSDYDRYRLAIFNHKVSSDYWKLFVEKMNLLSAKEIEVTILIAPYNPTFIKLLAKEYPEVYATHLAWIHNMEQLRIPHVHVVNDFAGILGDDQGLQYWSDGVHFTCKGAMIMLKPVLTH